MEAQIVLLQLAWRPFAAFLICKVKEGEALHLLLFWRISKQSLIWWQPFQTGSELQTKPKRFTQQVYSFNTRYNDHRKSYLKELRRGGGKASNLSAIYNSNNSDNFQQFPTILAHININYTFIKL